MKRQLTVYKLFAFIALFFFGSIIYAQNFLESTKQIRDRIAEYALSRPAESKSVDEILSLMRSDGSFTDRGPDLFVIEDRILKLAQAYYSDPKYKGNINLKNSIYNALDYWVKNESLPNSGKNWTYDGLLKPRSVGLIAVLMYEPLKADFNSSNSSVQAKAQVVNQHILDLFEPAFTNNTPFFETDLGANLSSRVLGGLCIAAYADSKELLDRVKGYTTETFKREIDIPGTDYPHAGLAPDYSFHQHNKDGRQNIWGNYGVVWLNDVTHYMTFVEGTQWQLSEDTWDIFFEAINEGARYFFYHDMLLYTVKGRNALRKNSLTSAINLSDIIKRVIPFAPNYLTQTEVQILKDFRNILRAGDRGLSTSNVKASKYFWTSDMLVHSRHTHYLGIKMLSNRTASLELGIGVNTKNFYMGDGSALIFKDGTEYREARVGWNISSIPGTTAEQEQDNIPVRAGTGTTDSRNDFAGGLSNGTHSVSGFILNKDQPEATVKARKGYFLSENLWSFLGNDIYQGASVDKEIWTTLNQTELRSNVTYSVDGNISTIPFGQQRTLTFNNVTQPAWFHHDGVGYIILPSENPVKIQLWAENRTGVWRDLDQRNPGGNETVGTFHLVINHGKDPKRDKYQYIVIPEASANEMPALANLQSVEILKNDPTLQAVYYKNLGMVQSVFYQANRELTLPTGMKISTDQPSVIMLTPGRNTLQLTLADPTWKADQIRVKINRQLSGDNVVWNPQAQISTVTINTPGGKLKGKATDVTLTYTNEDTPDVIAAISTTQDVIETGETLNLSGANSYSTKGNILEYSWNLGNGETKKGQTISHQYQEPGKYTVQLTVTNDAGASAATSKVITVIETNEKQECDVVSTWKNTDIGNTSIEGTTCFDTLNNTLTVSSSGDDIWNAADAFHFVYQETEGDLDVITKVDGIVYTDAWAKAGVMIRTSLDPNSSHVMMVVTAGRKCTFQSRLGNGDLATSTHAPVVDFSLPFWVKIEKRGNIYRGYYATKENQWQLIDTYEFDLGNKVLTGIATTSHTNEESTEALYSDFHINSVEERETSKLSFNLEGSFEVNEDFKGIHHIKIIPDSANIQPEDLDKITYKLTYDDTSIVEIDMLTESSQITFESFPDANGVVNLTLEGKLYDQTYITEFQLYVLPINDPPIFNLSKNTVIFNPLISNTIETVFLYPMSPPADESSEEITYTISPQTGNFASLTFDAEQHLFLVSKITDKEGIDTFNITANDEGEENSTFSRYLFVKYENGNAQLSENVDNPNRKESWFKDCFREIDESVVIEAENYLYQTLSQDSKGKSSYWTIQRGEDASNRGFIYAEGTGFNARDNAIGASLTYEIEFTHPGTYYLTTRMWGNNGENDSFHAGINEILMTKGHIGITNNANRWEWQHTFNKDYIKIEIDSAGKHNFKVWLREDGVKLDKFILTKAVPTIYVPNEFGPVESSRCPVNYRLVQTIDISKIEEKYIGDSSFQITAVTNSNLPLFYKIISGPAVISENEVFLTGDAGKVVIEVFQPGDDTYFPARERIEFFVLEKSTPSTELPCIQEIEGIVVIEAEDYTTKIAGEGNDTYWAVEENTNSSNNRMVKGGGPIFNSGKRQTGARLDFQINFVNTGIYYLWVRMLGPNGIQDSFYPGFNEKLATQGSGMSNASNQWVWEHTSDKEPVKINVVTAGEHNLNLWVRESGIQIDKIILTKDPKFTPKDLGPLSNVECGEVNYKDDSHLRLQDGTYDIDVEVNDKISVSPNPTSPSKQTTVNLSYEESGKTDLLLFDSMGKLVRTYLVDKKLTYDHFDIDISGLSQGMYFIKVNKLDKVIGTRFFIK